MEEEPQEPQKPELSKQGKQEQKRILSSMEEMQDISSEEFDRRVQLGIEKERKKLRWNNLNAGTKFNVILTAVLILTAIVALFFQWKANSTTRENLDLFQKEFELSYRPYISIVNTDINIANDSLQLLFHYNNSGKVPAVVQVERTYGIYNSFDKFSEIIIFPGISQQQTMNFRMIKNGNFDINITIKYKDQSTNTYQYETIYSYIVNFDNKKLEIKSISAN